MELAKDSVNRSTSRPTRKARKPRKRSPVGSIKSWHWIASAVCLIATLGFALTGITLNHASRVEATPTKTTFEMELPPATHQALVKRQQELLQTTHSAEASLPSVFRQWYQQQAFGMRLTGVEAEWDMYEVYVGLPQAGGDRWFRVDLESGELYQENIDRGWVAYFNDLHKGRNTSGAWVSMLDILAIIMLVYAITGLILLKRYAKGRKSTWPLVIAGLIIPWLFLMVPAHASGKDEVQLTLTIPALNVAEYHRPYVAIWLADGKHQRVQDLAVLYDGKMANREGEKWLKDIRQWWRRSGRSQEMPMDGVSGATKRPGTHTFNFSEVGALFKQLPAGDYFLNIEAAREVGGREHIVVPISLPIEPNKQILIKAEGEHELGLVELNILLND